MHAKGWMLAAVGLVTVGGASALLHAKHARQVEAEHRKEADAAKVAAEASPAMPEPPGPLPSCVAYDATPLPEAVPTVAAASAPPAPALPSVADDTAKPQVESTEELRRKVLQAAEEMARLVKVMEEAKSDDEQMEHMGALMQAALTLKRHEKSMTGDLAADVHMTMLDGVLPAELRLSQDQKTRYRTLMRDAEREMEMYGLGKSMAMTGDSTGLTEAQRGHMARIQGNLSTAMEQIMTPAQRDHLHGMNQGGGASRFEIRIGGPGSGEGPPPPPQSP